MKWNKTGEHVEMGRASSSFDVGVAFVADFGLPWGVNSLRRQLASSYPSLESCHHHYAPVPMSMEL